MPAGPAVDADVAMSQAVQLLSAVQTTKLMSDDAMVANAASRDDVGCVSDGSAVYTDSSA